MLHTQTGGHRSVLEWLGTGQPQQISVGREPSPVLNQSLLSSGAVSSFFRYKPAGS